MQISNKIYNRIKTYFNKEDCYFYKDIINDDSRLIKNTYMLLKTKIPFENGYKTIKPIQLLLIYDEIFNNELNSYDDKKFYIILQSYWDNKTLNDQSNEYKYEINNINDFNFEKIKTFYNEKLSHLQFNNFEIVEDDLKDLLKNIIGE